MNTPVDGENGCSILIGGRHDLCIGDLLMTKTRTILF